MPQSSDAGGKAGDAGGKAGDAGGKAGDTGDKAGALSLAQLAYRYLGIELAPVSHAERIISGIGGLIAIYLLIVFERGLLGETGAAMLVASMGASAVLLFAVPHGALSQPWAVIVGHTASAIIGVTCAKLIADTPLAAAVAVGISISGMYYLRAIHPPGGATALTAVAAGPQVHDLGYSFVATPVLINACFMIAAAVLFNALFRWRRYPIALGQRAAPATSRSPVTDETTAMEHADFMSALNHIGTYVDITEAEFTQLRALIRDAAAERQLPARQVQLRACYSNGAFGTDWAVRRIIDESGSDVEDSIIWRTVAGKGRNESGTCTRAEFARWAMHEVVLSENSWIRANKETVAT